MLHLLFQTTLDQALMQRFESNDDVVFLENSVFRLINGNSLSANLLQLLTDNVQLYVLQEELETRGIIKDKLLPGVKVTDYSGLVELTEKNKLIYSWR